MSFSANATSISSNCFNNKCTVTVNGVIRSVPGSSVSVSNINGKIYINGVPWSTQSGNRAAANPAPPAPKTYSHPQLCKGAVGTFHANGGGFVALTASVGRGVYVSKESAVCENASVSGAVSIQGRSLVTGNASVSGASVISNSVIMGNTDISGATQAMNVKLDRGSYSGADVIRSSAAGSSNRGGIN